VLKQARLEQIIRLMEELGWDVLVLYANGWRKEHVRCLLDIDTAGPHSVVAVTKAGEVHAFFCDPWDYELARSRANGDVRVELAANLDDGLSRLPGGRTAVAGLEMMPARFVLALGEPVSATATLEKARRIKTEKEIDELRRAAALADDGYRVFVDTLHEGMSEYELVAEVEAALKAEGAEDNFMLLSSGGPEVRSMKPATGRTFIRGDIVATELTPSVNGYYAQICRTLVVGEPSAAQHEAFEIFREAQAAGEALLKPGVRIGDVARAENDVFRAAGFGKYTGPEYTRVRGHGLGLFVDEKPQILEDVDVTVEEGMVLIVHPNTYLPTVGYMVFGDALLVTGDGCESLATTERKLFHT